MQKFYQFSYWLDNATCEATINGFPIFNRPIKGGSGGGPIDPYLIGRNNKLRIEATPTDENAVFRFSLIEMDAGSMGGGIEDMENQSLTPGKTLVIEREFDSDNAPFAPTLNSATTPTREELHAFAESLKSKLAARDTEAIVSMCRPKIEMIALVYGAPFEVMSAQIAEMIAEFAICDFTFDTATINLVPHCDGKVWEFRKADGAPFVHGEHPEGYTIAMHVYVAKLPGGVFVVA